MKSDAGGGVGVQGIKVKAHSSNQNKHVGGATKVYVPIRSRKTRKFNFSTSSNSVYMTIYSASGRKICKNQEINESSNYIITRDGCSLVAKKETKRIDTGGHDHISTDDDSDGFDAQESGDDVPFDPAKKFTNNESGCW